MKNAELLQSGAQNLAGDGALATELGTVLILIVVTIGFAIETRRRGSLSIPALCAIAGLSIFWQEFYADWGSYLLWSPKFHMMPWGSTLWTTPDKPWFVVASYPLFMCFAFTTMLTLNRFVVGKFPSANLFLVCLFTAAPALFLINFALEAAAVALAGQWSYVDTLGPALITDKGRQPILYPGIPFGIWGAVLCYLIMHRDDTGHPRFERLTSSLKFAQGWKRESMRIVAWMVTWNLTYWLLLSAPLIALREFFGQPNALVP